MDINELNERRINLKLRLDALGMQNQAREAEEIMKQQAEYKLAFDAWQRAENDYRAALDALSTDELIQIATTPHAAFPE